MRSLPPIEVVSWDAASNGDGEGDATLTLRTPEGALVKVTTDYKGFQALRTSMDKMAPAAPHGSN